MQTNNSQPNNSQLEVTPEVEAALDAILNFSEGSLETRFDNLIQALISFNFYLIDRERRTGLPIQEHEQRWLKNAMEQVRNIEKLFALAKKHGRMTTVKAGGNFDGETVAKIREMKSSLGEIVRKMPGIEQPEE